MADDNDILNDRAEGSLKKTGGQVEESAGRAIGDQDMKREGEKDQAEGKVQKAWGDVKNAAKDLVDDD